MGYTGVYIGYSAKGAEKAYITDKKPQKYRLNNDVVQLLGNKCM